MVGCSKHSVLNLFNELNEGSGVMDLNLFELLGSIITVAVVLWTIALLLGWL